MPGREQGGPARRRRRRPSPSTTANQGETRFLAVGEVAAPRGVRGDMRVRILTDFPERLKSLKTVYLGEEQRPFGVESVRVLPDQAIIKLKGIDTPEQARELQAQLIYVPVSEAVPLEEGQYYWYQILGLEVCTKDDRCFGKITDILTTGSNDVYIVKGEQGEVLVPAIEDVVVEIDLEKGRMIIEPLEGML